MKNLFILLLFIFIISSCSKNNDNSIIKESGTIINDYTNTLESSIKNSKEVKDMIEINQNKLLENINSIK